MDDTVVRFRDSGCSVGEYVLNDRFKPHFRCLRTPSGHNVVVVSPGDHRHHKGLMYALRSADLNFWEEEPESGSCGVQDVLDTKLIDGGIEQRILWRGLDGSLPTYEETRRISCRLEEGEGAYRWMWTTQRRALRDHWLIKSEWSSTLPDGRVVNYHGLGIRLPWMWAFNSDAFCGLESQEESIDAQMACGTNGGELSWWGRIDGQWSPTLASVTIKQDQDFTWYTAKGDFPYLSVGPSNRNELEVEKDSVAEEKYEIVVADRL